MSKGNSSEGLIEISGLFKVTKVFEGTIFRTDEMEVSNWRVVAGLFGVHGQSRLGHKSRCLSNDRVERLSSSNLRDSDTGIGKFSAA